MHSLSTGDLTTYVPHLRICASLMFDLSWDQAPLSYLSDQTPFPLPMGGREDKSERVTGVEVAQHITLVKKVVFI